MKSNRRQNKTQKNQLTGLAIVCGGLIIVIMVAAAMLFKKIAAAYDPVYDQRVSVDKVQQTEPDTSAVPVNAVPTNAAPRLNLANISTADLWMYTLVNAAHPWEKIKTPELECLSNGLEFDARAIGQLNAMLAAMRAEGLSPVVCSAYRSIEKQQALFDQQVDRMIARGLSLEEADIQARSVVAYPGTSEHNLGLAADIVSESYQLLEDDQEDTPEVQWLHEHCAEYGFILRYPRDKTDITGVIYEPWHFRFVGVELAREVMDSGLCLEEYLGMD